MATVNTIDSGALNAINGTSTSQASTAQELSTNFMTLLVTQLKNQDPLKPLENTELTSQLAQINTVNGIDALNDTMQNINNQIEAGQSLQAVALIGQGVMVPGDRILMGDEGVSTPFGMELPNDASEVTITISDGAGQVLRQFDLGAVPAGVDTFAWDGLTDSGEQAPAGSYKVTVAATGVDGGAMLVEPLNYAVVNGVSTGGDGGPRLDLGGITEPVLLSDVRQIL